MHKPQTSSTPQLYAFVSERNSHPPDDVRTRAMGAHLLLPSHGNEFTGTRNANLVPVPPTWQVLPTVLSGYRTSGNNERWGRDSSDLPDRSTQRVMSPTDTASCVEVHQLHRGWTQLATQLLVQLSVSR